MSEYYNTRFKHDGKREVVWRAIAKYLQQFVQKDGAVLDLGCGYGDFINQIMAADKYAIDLDESNSKYLGAEVKYNNQSALEPFKGLTNKIDVVFASNFLEHFGDSELVVVIENIKTCLVEGGKLILIQPNFRFASTKYWDDYTHKKAFSHESLPDFLKSSGFSVTKVYPRFLPFSMKSILPKSYWLTWFYLNSPIKPMAGQMCVVASLKS